jgi:hypothetical protein
MGHKRQKKALFSGSFFVTINRGGAKMSPTVPLWKWRLDMPYFFALGTLFGCIISFAVRML